MAKVEFPEKLVERWKALLGEEFYDFIDALQRPLRPSLRVNTLKISVEELKAILAERGIGLEPVPWCPWGFWVDGIGDEESLGNMWEHFAGLIYKQEPSSMIPPEVMKPTEGDLVLDLAAAPGSKTTQLAQHMKNEGLIVANDVNVKGIKALTSNLERLGVLNVCVTQMDGMRFGRLFTNVFDMVLVDAPCSAEGTIRKSYKAVFEWGEWVSEKLSRIQRMLLVSAFKATRPGGIIVYSTCTFAPEENEGVVSYLLERYPVETVEIKLEGLNASSAVMEWNGERFHEGVARCVRVYPHKNDVGGFFVAKLRKLDDGKG